MGTRAVVRVKDERGKPLAAVYIHYDGYPEGALLWPLSILARKHYTNGFTDPLASINGMDDFMAQLVALLKLQDTLIHFRMRGKEPSIDDIVSITAGDVYIVPPDVGDVLQEYEYEFYPKNGAVWVRVVKVDRKTPLFEGSIADYVGKFGKN